MARPGHWGDCAGVWNRLVKELWVLVGQEVLNDHLKNGKNSALMAIREVRKSRNAKQGNSEIQMEAKILLCFRDGIPWSEAFARRIDYIIPWQDGGKEELKNIRLVENGATKFQSLPVGGSNPGGPIPGPQKVQGTQERHAKPVLQK